MKIALLYSSQHGRTRKAVQEALPRLAAQADLFDAKDLPTAAQLLAYQVWLVFTPTYGDEELQLDMENFLRGFSADLAGRRFAICELGNYGGYDDFSFGALHIVRRRLLELNGVELCVPLSLDSMPRISWEHLHQWVAVVNQHLAAS
ncbi:MAG TPA: flavodoxin family protein [Candidatus Didemnitutus sp.]|nr:flavodoxin family protein [Candidatus Didemnitutus sp.]